MFIEKIVRLNDTEKDKILKPLIDFFKKNNEPCANVNCKMLECADCPLAEFNKHFVILRDIVADLAKDNNINID